ncbi:MAG: EVE domain-containing protein [Candidatus Acidiferrales bacterium]
MPVDLKPVSTTQRVRNSSASSNSEVSQNYWALMANPEMYRIQLAVEELTKDDWFVDGSDVKKGDRVAIWKAKGRGKQRGVVAFGEVLTNPAMMPPRPHSKKYYPKGKPVQEEAEPRVDVRYLRPSRVPLWLENDDSGVLGDLSVARARGRTVFKIRPDQWGKLVAALGGWPLVSQAHAEDAAAEAADAVDALRSRDQGFQSDSVVRRAVEQYAVERAVSHFKGLGYAVETVGKPYDLKCTRKRSVLYVEVKGTQTKGAEILLTPGEVKFAKAHEGEIALFVLHDVTVSRVGGNVSASGGTVHPEPNWIINSSRLSPLGYSYLLSERQKGSE